MKYCPLTFEDVFQHYQSQFNRFFGQLNLNVIGCVRFGAYSACEHQLSLFNI